MAAVTGWIPLTGDRWIPECAFSMLFNTCRCSATTDKSTGRRRSKSTEPSESAFQLLAACWFDLWRVRERKYCCPVGRGDQGESDSQCAPCVRRWHSRGAQYWKSTPSCASTSPVVNPLASRCNTLQSAGHCARGRARAHTLSPIPQVARQGILKVSSSTARALAGAPKVRPFGGCTTQDLTTAAAQVWPPSRLHVQLPKYGHTVGSTCGQSIFGHSPCTAASRNEASCRRPSCTNLPTKCVPVHWRHSTCCKECQLANTAKQ